MAKTIRSRGHIALCATLVAARHAAGLTQTDLARRLRCHQSLVARIEKGDRRIDVVELVVIARALEVPPAELLEAAERATPVEHRI